MATGRPPGRPAKPVEKKRAEGNLGKRKLPEQPVVEDLLEDIPEAPEHLTEEGVSVWVRIWKAGAGWLKPDRDYIHAQLFVDAFCEYQYLRRMLKLGSKGGGVDRVYTAASGYPVQHPYVSQLKEATKSLNTYASMLALSPADFARLQIAETNDAERELIENLLTRRA